ANVGRLSGKLRCLGLTETFTGFDERVERFSVQPIQLIHSPRRDGRFGKALYAFGLVRPAFSFQPCSQRVPRAGAIRQRQGEQGINITIRIAHYLVTCFRMGRPATVPVNLPSSTASFPFTRTYFMPVAKISGCSYVERSAMVPGSNAMTSAKKPGVSRPR